MVEQPAGTVTLVFTDIEGSTRLLKELGQDVYRDELARHREIVRAAFGSHGGYEVDSEGDAFFYAFGSAADALAAVEEAVTALADGPIRVRVGVHTGEPGLDPPKYVGMDVHRAARIMAAGHGGQVVVSEQARLASGRELRPLGAHRLKDLTAPEPLWQLGDAEFPPLKSLNQTNLPVQASPLIGRGSELRETGALLRQNRVVTLLGPGGSGKTRLGLQLAAGALKDFPHGVWWVPLQALRDPTLLLPTIASTLGAQSDLVEHLMGKRLLLVLDNMEQLVDAAGDLAELLSATGDLKLLVTSREPLRIAGEAEYAVEPLPDDDAIALFQARAAVSEPLEAVREICRRLDCLPLAIELAAARTKLFPPEQLITRLDQRLPLLTGGRRDAPERQRTLRATIEWSHDLLSEDEKRLFPRLAVFAGSFDVDAAEQVCDAELDTLQSLIEKSLLRRWASGRLGMLETIYEYASERLIVLREARTRRDRHAAYFADAALEHDRNLRFGRQAESLRRLRADYPNIRAAIEHCLASGDRAGAAAIAQALMWFWLNDSSAREGRTITARVLEASPSPSPGLLFAAGRLAVPEGDFDAADAHFAASLTEAKRVGDVGAVANALSGQAYVASVTGRGAEAVALADRAVALTRGLGPDLQAEALSALGSALGSNGEFVRAEATYNRELEICRAAGLLGPAAIALMNLGWIALHEDRIPAATVAFSDALNLAQQGESALTAIIEANLGIAALLDGSLESAEHHLSSALRELAAMNARPAAAECLLGLAALNAASGEMERASILRAAWRREHVKAKTVVPAIHQRIEDLYLGRLEGTDPPPDASFEEVVEIALAPLGPSAYPRVADPPAHREWAVEDSNHPVL